MKLYTNSNAKLDFVGKRLEELCENRNLYISVAFFSHSDFILKSIQNGCSKIDLIVKLDFGTNPEELTKIINNPNVNIRYYTDRFHPKFYIIDGLCAILGSSNLSKNGLGTNLEINIEIENDNPIYEELKYEFSLEWDNASVLTNEKLEEYKKICHEHGVSIPDIGRIVSRKIGEVSPPNITTYDKKEASKLFIESFRKEYQHYISSFERLKNMYTTLSPERKYNETCPLRIEVDGFLSWLWDFQCDHNDYKAQSILSDEKIKDVIKPLKNEFLKFKGSDYYDNLPSRHSIKQFSTISGIESLSEEEICNLLERVWAFHDRLRFYSGGLENMKKEFIKKNEGKIKKSIIYILYGSGDYVLRIYNSLFLPQYKLEMFGESCVKELFGLVNQEDIPICNGRTKKAMQWLGFGPL